MLEIHFRGPILFMKERGVDTVKAAYIPNGDNRQLKHADGSTAIPHFARLAFFDKSGTHLVEPISLMGCEIHIDVAGTTGATLQKSADTITRLNQVTNGGKENLRPLSMPELKALGASIVNFGSGELHADHASSYEWEFTGDFNPGYQPKPTALPLWTIWKPHPSATEVGVTIKNANLEIEFKLNANSPNTYIYNFDSKKPNPDKLNLKGSYKEKDLEDIDFKWLYQLLTPEGADWGSWRHGKRLPAPISYNPNGANSWDEEMLMFAKSTGGDPYPLVSGCFDAIWEL